VAREAQQAIPLHGSYFCDAEVAGDMQVSVTVRQLPDGAAPGFHERSAD
jgi:hypothetical protein